MEISREEETSFHSALLISCFSPVLKCRGQGDQKRIYPERVHSDEHHPVPLVACTLMCLGALRVSWPSDHLSGQQYESFPCQ